MKYLLPLIILIISCVSLQNRKTTISEVVETACGLCFYDMTTDECRIAVKINDKTYFVENTSIKEYCDLIWNVDPLPVEITCDVTN